MTNTTAPIHYHLHGNKKPEHDTLRNAAIIVRRRLGKTDPPSKRRSCSTTTRESAKTEGCICMLVERERYHISSIESICWVGRQNLSPFALLFGEMFLFLFFCCFFFVAHNKQMILARLLTIPPNTDDSHTNTGSVAEGWVLLECSGTFCTKEWWGKGALATLYFGSERVISVRHF